MTLIEILIAIAIMSLAIGIAVPSLSSKSRADLRKEAGRLSSYMRYVYNFAVTENLHCKIIINLEGDEQTYHTRCSEDVDYIPGEQLKPPDEFALNQKAERGEAVSEDVGSDGGEELSEEDSGDGDGIDLGLAPGQQLPSLGRKKANYMQLAEELVERVRLPAPVRIRDVWVAHQTEPFDRGVVFIHFFPQGYAEPTVLHLVETDGNTVMTLELKPMTGKVVITNGDLAAGQS